MQNAPTQSQPEKTESFSLTKADQTTIILALGALAGMAGLDDRKQMQPMAKEALRVARKFGVTYE